MNTTTATVDTYAPLAVRDNIDDARKIAAVVTSPAVLATLDRFDGKVINRRLWDALTVAAREVDDGATIYAPTHPDLGQLAEISVQNWKEGMDGRRYPAGRISRTIYAEYSDGRRAPLAATGSRLDAAAVRAEFQKEADHLRAGADELEEQAGRFPEFLAEVRDLAARAHAFLERWRYELRDQAHGLHSALGTLDIYRNATTADFREGARYFR